MGVYIRGKVGAKVVGGNNVGIAVPGGKVAVTQISPTINADVVIAETYIHTTKFFQHFFCNN